MFLSVVIPTYNRLPILEKCLRALEQQQLQTAQIVEALKTAAPAAAAAAALPGPAAGVSLTPQPGQIRAVPRVYAASWSSRPLAASSCLQAVKAERLTPAVPSPG